MYITLMHFYNALIRKIWVFILCVVLGMTSGVVLKLLNPVKYAATVTMISLDIDKVSIFGETATLEDLNTSRRIAGDFKALIEGNRVTALAAKKLGEQGFKTDPKLLPDMISIASAADSNIISLTVTADNPDIAVPASNALAEAFVTVLKEITGSYYVNVWDKAEDIDRVNEVPLPTYLILGFFAGAILGVAIIYFSVILDDKIRLAEDISYITDINTIIIPDSDIV